MLLRVVDDSYDSHHHRRVSNSCSTPILRPINQPDANSSSTPAATTPTSDSSPLTSTLCGIVHVSSKSTFRSTMPLNARTISHYCLSCSSSPSLHSRTFLKWSLYITSTNPVKIWKGLVLIEWMVVQVHSYHDKPLKLQSGEPTRLRFY